MEDYQKLTESFYRWEYAQNKKLSLRFFGGLLLITKQETTLLTLEFLKYQITHFLIIY